MAKRKPAAPRRPGATAPRPRTSRRATSSAAPPRSGPGNPAPATAEDPSATPSRADGTPEAWIGPPASETEPAEVNRLDVERYGAAARTGRDEILEHLQDHTEGDPSLTAGDIDADWQSAYSTGDEAPGGDNPTPGQDVVDEVGRALGVEYQDDEELRASDKVGDRDRHRWEWDPASADDYPERSKRPGPADDEA